MEGRCQYGDYCSFLHDKKPRDLPLTDDKSSCTRDRKPISLNNSFSVSSKAGHKDLLIPSVRVDADVIDKSRSGGLPAFASRFSQTPVRVEPPREIVAAPTPKRKVSPAGSATLKAHTPPVPTSEPVSLPMAVATSAPPKSNAWFKGPPVPIKKIRSLKKVTIADMGHKRDLSVSLDAPLKTPTSAGALAIPLSAMSLWTESDPSTPFDPMTHRKRMLEIEEEAKKSGHIKVMPKSSLVNLAFDSSPAPSQVFTPSESFLPFTAPAYPWGMPMSPISLGAYQDPLIPDIKGGLGVIWTPAGWAVQDAAMKQTLRSPEIKQKFENEKKRPYGVQLVLASSLPKDTVLTVRNAPFFISFQRRLPSCFRHPTAIQPTTNPKGKATSPKPCHANSSTRRQGASMAMTVHSSTLELSQNLFRL